MTIDSPEAMLGTRDNPYLYFGTLEPIQPVPAFAITPSGYSGWCSELGILLEDAVLGWLQCPAHGDHDFVPTWVFRARQMIYQMEAFRPFHRYYEFEKRSPVRICGHLFESAHIGIEKFMVSLIEKTETLAVFWREKEERNGRARGATYGYTPAVWIGVAKDLKDAVGPFDFDSFKTKLEEEYEIVRTNNPELWPEDFWGESDAIQDKPTTKRERDRAKVQWALGYIATQPEACELTLVQLADIFGVSRSTLSKPSWAPFRAALKLARESQARDSTKGRKMFDESGRQDVDGIINPEDRDIDDDEV